MKFTKKTFACRVLKYSHTGVTIYKILTNIFNEYQINKSIFSITFDHAKLNNKIIKLMIKHLSLPLDVILFHA